MIEFQMSLSIATKSTGSNIWVYLHVGYQRSALTSNACGRCGRNRQIFFRFCCDELFCMPPSWQKIPASGISCRSGDTKKPSSFTKKAVMRTLRSLCPLWFVNQLPVRSITSLRALCVSARDFLLILAHGRLFGFGRRRLVPGADVLRGACAAFPRGVN